MEVAPFTLADFLVMGSAAVLVGMRRGGITGPAIVAVVLLGLQFPPGTSIGIGVVLFLHADIQAVPGVVRDVQWRTLASLVAPTLVGIALGAWAGRAAGGPALEWALLVLVTLAFVAMVRQRFGNGPPQSPPSWIALPAGLMLGFTTMIGNLASAFVAVYFAAIRAGKREFIATTVFFFFVVNLIKLPVHIFVWKTVTPAMIAATLILVPCSTVGIVIGRAIVRRMREEVYWRFVVIVTALAIARYGASVVGW